MTMPLVIDEQIAIAFIATYLYAQGSRGTTACIISGDPFPYVSIKDAVKDAREIWELSQDEGDDDGEDDPILDGHSLGI